MPDSWRARLPAGWVEVSFPLRRGPATSMGMAAEALTSDTVRLPRAPWAALGAAKGDVFRVRPDADGALRVQEKLEASGYCAIRVDLNTEGPLGPLDPSVDSILDRFTPLNVTGQGMFGLAVLDIPPDADLAAVHRLLADGRRDRWWNYAELSVTDAWRAAAPSCRRRAGHRGLPARHGRYPGMRG